jgi:xylitol oxidase
MILFLFLLFTLLLPSRSLNNWAGNVQLAANDDSIATPTDTAALKHILATNTGFIKPLGTSHSFSTVAETKGTLVRMTDLNNVISLDTTGKSVTVQPGITYAALGKYLHRQGFALSQYASLPHITVGGAIATSTHGSGMTNQILASSVLKYEMFGLDEALSTWTFTPSDPHFYSALVSMGSVGILTSVTLKIMKQYQIKQCIYPDINWSILLHDNNVSSFFNRAYSVSAFTDWKQHSKDGADLLSSVWLKHKIEPRQSNEKDQEQCPLLLNVTARAYHPLPLLDPAGCSPIGLGPSHVMLPHFLPDNKPSGGGHELQSEYFISLHDAAFALEALRSISDQLAPYVQVTEFRVVASDAFPMSVCYNKATSCFGIHFTWINDVDGVTHGMLPLVERTLSQWQPRPHNGKLHTLPTNVWRQRYPGHVDVLIAAQTFDPKGRLKNNYLQQFLYNEPDDMLQDTDPTVDKPKMSDPRLAQIIKDFQDAANDFEGMDAVDQILMDQVDDILNEDDEDLEALSSLNEQMEHMMASNDLFGDLGLLGDLDLGDLDLGDLNLGDLNLGDLGDLDGIGDEL